MARKLIKTLTVGTRTAKVYRDAEWNEYRIVFDCGGTYHTDDKVDALATAQHYVNQPATQ